jgi:hypothetical protein
MKTSLPFLILFLFLTGESQAQLTLQRVSKNKTATFSKGTEIGFKLPIQSAKGVCDCYQYYEGTLRDFSGDSATIVLKVWDRRYYENENLARQEIDKYHYHKEPVSTKIGIGDAESITKYHRNKKTLEGIGAVLMLFSVAQALILNPLLPQKKWGAKEAIALGGFGAGAVTSQKNLLPKTSQKQIGTALENKIRSCLILLDIV